MSRDETILEDQKAYYKARAAEYDQWFLRAGRYDRGEAQRKQWFGEVALVERALEQARPRGRILELACGTGLWTQRLLPFASELTAVDASPEVLAVNRGRLASPKVRYVEADLFNWSPPAVYDFVFFSFWLSHVPRPRFESFWKLVGSALEPGGSVFFVDSLFNPSSMASDHRLPDDSDLVERKLNDGSRFRIVKVFYQPGELGALLRGLSWEAQVACSGEYFIYGHCRQAA